MGKAVLMSINRPHTDNIHAGRKTSELRTRPPKLQPPFKVYVYETLKAGGCGKVVSEWTCHNMTEWCMCMGIPERLPATGCISAEDIRSYCDSGRKNITEMEISDLVVYDHPRDLSEFFLVRPPQSWCYVEENIVRV